MAVAWFLSFLVICNSLHSCAVSASVSTRPISVNIGCAFSLNSTIGKVVKIAIDAATEDINSSPRVLRGTLLKLRVQEDTKASRFQAVIETMKLMESEAVAVIGAETATTAHVVSHIANELNVPLLSVSATDPTMSPLQYPFFVLTAQSDLFQMAAIAAILNHYKWREVIAIYSDDDDGRNSITTLGEKVAEDYGKITYRAALKPDASEDDITSMLIQVRSEASRVIVVHVPIAFGSLVFDVAQVLNMTGNGYVWIATSWLSTLLDTENRLPIETHDKFLGVLTLRMHSQDSNLKRAFVSRWRNLSSSEGSHDLPGLNVYGLYAYDTVWLVARALDAFFKDGGNITFTKYEKLYKRVERFSSFRALKFFDGGKLLLKKIEQTNMTGITGPLSFTSDRFLLNPAFEVLNAVGNGYRRIGYWSNYSGLSIVPPEALHQKEANITVSSQQLSTVIWPGDTKETPLGWVFPSGGREFVFGVPNRVYYRELLSRIDESKMFIGFCVDVFRAALNLLPYPVSYKLEPFGDGKTNPSPTDLVRQVRADVYDGAIGDIAITTARTTMADFTQPFIQSGIAFVAPIRKLSPSMWSFLRPFTPQMWGVSASFFLFVGAVIWVLEHRVNDQFRGPPKKQVVTTLWFIFSTLFTAQKEKVLSTLGRFVVIVWLLVVFIINNSYTASLSSILTAEKLSYRWRVNATDGSLRIGYQRGSFLRHYMTDEYRIDKKLLVPLNSLEEIDKAFADGPENGGISAYVDERPYVELFLSTRCYLTIIDEDFTTFGWGFVSLINPNYAIIMICAF
uniref:Glutamate receptor n=1 Tax=Kalanchoe fedtschenkoi TaxID=63787 RepID=A0A7N0UMV9_KALFE